jgi:hypothetical protein
MNRKELRIIFKNFFYGILTAAIVAGCWLSCYAQVKAGLDVTESLVEWVQEALLLLTAGTFYLMARRDRSERGGLVLMGSLFAAMLIRENDRLLNVGEMPVWEALLAVSLLVLALWERGRGPEILKGLAAFCRSGASPVMITGLALLLVGSRLFGSHLIWQYVVSDDNTHYAVRRLTEESLELVSYCVCWIGARIYSRERRGLNAV